MKRARRAPRRAPSVHVQVLKASEAMTRYAGAYRLRVEAACSSMRPSCSTASVMTCDASPESLLTDWHCEHDIPYVGASLVAIKDGAQRGGFLLI